MVFRNFITTLWAYFSLIIPVSVYLWECARPTWSYPCSCRTGRSSRWDRPHTFHTCSYIGTGQLRYRLSLGMGRGETMSLQGSVLWSRIRVKWWGSTIRKQQQFDYKDLPFPFGTGGPFSWCGFRGHALLHKKIYNTGTRMTKKQ